MNLLSLDNSIDRQLVDSIDKQKKMGVHIADAIADSYGLEEDELIYENDKDVPD